MTNATSATNVDPFDFWEPNRPIPVSRMAKYLTESNLHFLDKFHIRVKDCNAYIWSR